MPAPTFNEIFDLGAAEATLKRPDLAVREGDISEMLLSGAAAMADRVVGYAAERFNATYVDGARGADLTTLADDHWGIQRLTANKATGTVTITRSGASGPDPVTYAIGTVVATERDAQGNEVRFLTTQVAAWAAGVNGDQTVNVEAEIAGSAANLVADEITRIISASPGSGTYTVTASSLTAGGTEDETDEELRARVRAYPSTLRRATISALEYGAQTVAGIQRATAVEDAGGIVTVYVSDLAGSATGSTVEVSDSVVDDGTMTHDVAIELEAWRAAGSLVYVAAGQVQTIDIAVTLTVRAGANVPQIVSQVEDSITSAVNRLKIGDTLYRSLIIAAVKIVDPDNIMEVEVTAPLTNTAPTGPGYIIRAGTITVS